MRKGLLGNGFSLIEMLIALFFTLVLMGGMAVVFKSSLSSFTTSADTVSSTRRNRLAMDLLSDDLNSAGQYLTLEAPPSGIVDTNPSFAINPNVAFTGTDIPPGSNVSDQLLFYFDDPLALQGTFGADVMGTASYVATGTVAPTSGQAVVSVVLKAGDDPNSIKSGMMLLTRGNYEHKLITNVSVTGATTADLTLDGMFSEAHLKTSEGVVIARPAQYVRYSIQSRNWDPENPSSNGIPCLVREQGPYPGSGTFTPDATLTTIVAENVSKFTVSLSADHGTSWATGADWTALKTSLNTTLATSGAPGFTSISSTPHWYRYVPLLMRVNVTTRTAVKRGEYSPAGNALAYKEQTQTLLLTPRHFGLSF